MNRALMATRVVDRVRGTLFPVITGQTGLNAIFRGRRDHQSAGWWQMFTIPTVQRRGT